MKEEIRFNAELLIETLEQQAGVTLGYDQDSVAWVEGYIERQRERLDSESVQAVISVLGSFLGECIRHQYGGEWVDHEEGWAVCFDEGNCAFPFNKVQKQFALGKEESILSFFQDIPAIFSLGSARD